MGRRLAGAVLVLLGLGVVALVFLGLRAQPPGSFGSLTLTDARFYIGCALGAGVLYAAAVGVVRKWRVPGWTLPVVLLLGLVARLAVLAAPPIISTDIYRYVWDGRVQAAGINPYSYLPSDPALLALRDTAPGATAIYPNINRVDSAPTIYPPAAQMLFALIGLTLPSIWTVKAVMLGFDLLTTLVALLLLRAAARPSAQVLVWAWNPLVIWEFAGAGHIDAAALAASALAMLAVVRGRRAWGGLALGVAVLFKLLPAALFPALWRRWDWRVPVMAAVVILAGYGVYASVGLRVFGYLPGYASEEGLDGGGFLLLRLLALWVPVPAWAGAVYAVAALALLAGLAALVALPARLPTSASGRAEAVAGGALVLSGALIAVLSPHYPWYMTMLVLPAVLVPAWSALWLTIAGPLLYLDHGHGQVLWPALVFLPALPLLLIDLYAPQAAPKADPRALPADGGL